MPDRHPDPHPGWHLHWLNAPGRLDDRDAITRAIARAHALLAALMPPPPLDILIQRDRAATIPETGLGGRANHATLVTIRIDPANPHCPRTVVDGTLTRLVLHETHHALRMAGPGYGRTLGEALVSEGLAGRFAATLCGTPPEPWERAVDRPTILHHHARLPPLDRTGYDHAAWFFGRADIPRWFGYTLGYDMAGLWLDHGPAPDAERWIATPAADIIAIARADGLLPPTPAAPTAT